MEDQEQQFTERQRELNNFVQPRPGGASATLAAPAGSAKDVRTPADDIPHAALHGVRVVTVKLPLFWANSPEVCFAKFEAQFSFAHITQDRTGCNYVIGHLDAHYASQVQDILINPPTANLYELLKTELLRPVTLRRP